MVSHHSIAILTNEEIKKKTSNQEIIQLANEIIKTQKEEIRKMDNILNKINKS